MLEFYLNRSSDTIKYAEDSVANFTNNFVGRKGTIKHEKLFSILAFTIIFL